jgi:hypothetical protein
VEFPITQPVNGKMLVKVSEPEIEYGGSFSWIHITDRGLDITEDTMRMANIRIRVEQSQDSNYHVEIKKYSRGRNSADADMRAQKISFNASYKDSVLDVGSGIAIDKDSKFRVQQVIVIIAVPVNKKIRFDETVNKLHALSIRTNRDKKWHRYNGDFDINWDEYFDYETDIDYIMGKDGYLINPDKPEKKINPDGGYRYDDSTRKNKKDDLKRELKKIEEEEKKDSIRKKREGIKLESVDDVTYNNTQSTVNSPILSFTHLFN